MRTTIVTPQQRVLATLVKWTSLFLILLTVMAGTISGELPIGRTTLSGLEDQTCPPVPGPDGPPIFSHGTCIYTPSQNPCASGYTLPDPKGGSCVADPSNSNNNSSNNGGTCSNNNGGTCSNNNGGTCPPSNNNSGSCSNSNNIPPNNAPPTQSVNQCPSNFVSLSNNGGPTECQVDGGSGTIDPSCSPGYVNVNGSCYSNAPFDMGDPSSGNCTLTPHGEEGAGSGEESGPQTYLCPYTNAQLQCVITGPNEQCTMTKNAGAGGGTLGVFNCQGLNAGYPTGCTYYGQQNSLTTPLAIATCGRGHCTIETCWNASGGNPQFTAIIGASCLANPDNIQVKLQETCTPQVDGQKRVCDYDSTGGNSTKAVTLSISCDPTQTDTTDLSCSVAGPYKVVFDKRCVNTEQNQDIQATCYISNQQNSRLWVEQCGATANTSTVPECTVMTNDNLTLGTLHCDSASSCTITDTDGTNKIIISCANNICHSNNIPDCPHPVMPFAIAITEATIACDAKLVADMFMYGNGAGPNNYAIITPLSQIEMEFVLQRIGVGSQVWFPDKGLPEEFGL